MKASQQIETLTQRVREALEKGIPVIIVGWRDYNHDDFTRQISGRSKKVILLENDPNKVKNKGSGFIILTPYIDHKTSEAIGANQGLTLYNHIMGIWQIKEVLKKCADLLTPTPSECAGSPSEQCCSSVTPSRNQDESNEPDLDELEKALTSF